MTFTVGGTAGFTLSWFSVSTSLVAPPLLLSIFLARSVIQQIINEREFLKFKTLIKRILEDEEWNKTLRVFFIKEEVSRTTPIEMGACNSNKNSLPEFNFEFEFNQTLEEFIKAKMKEELGLIENLTQDSNLRWLV